jgi:folate-binding protein YgfZ
VVTVADYEQLVEGVGLADRSDRGKLILGGDEAAEFLQGQVTNDVEGLSPGRGQYAALLTHKGKIRADLRVLRDAAWLWLDTEPAGLPPLRRTVQMYSIGRDVRLEDVTATRAILSLLGPGADDALDRPPGEREHDWVEGEHGLYVRTDLGIDVICAADDAEGVRLALGVEPANPSATECLRIESGRPRLGLDIGEETIPQEAGLNERAVSFTKGCYVGQETVARLFYKGRPNRHLRGLRLGEPAEPGEEVRLGERAVGHVGSACVSPRFGPIALALLRREAEPGTEVSVGAQGRAGEVVELPFTAPATRPI